MIEVIAGLGVIAAVGVALFIYGFWFGPQKIEAERRRITYQDLLSVYDPHRDEQPSLPMAGGA